MYLNILDVKINYNIKMGRNKTLFSHEQDTAIKLLIEKGKTLDEVVNSVNEEFNTNISRSVINKRIKELNIIKEPKKLGRPKITNTDKPTKSKQDSTVNIETNDELGIRLIELKRQQGWYRKDDTKLITNKDIMEQLGIGIERFKELCTRYDVPQVMSGAICRPDLYYNVTVPDGRNVIIENDELIVDCTSVMPKHLDIIYDYLIEHLQKDVRIERNAIIDVCGATVQYITEQGKTATAEVKPIKMKVDLYFPDYNLAFYHAFVADRFTKDDYNVAIANSWSSYMKKYKNKIQLKDYVAMNNVTDSGYSLYAGAENILKQLK